MLPLLTLSALLPFVAPGEVIDLSHATMISTTDPRSAGAEGPVRKIADGDPGTVWSSGQVSLEELPANIVITWEQPVTVGSLEVLTNRLKGWLRLTWLEVYAGVGDGWALIGEVRDNRDERFVVDLVPTTLTRLRLRLRGTERPDQSYANLCEIGLRAGDPAQARPARQAAVADQGI